MRERGGDSLDRRAYSLVECLLLMQKVVGSNAMGRVVPPAVGGGYHLTRLFSSCNRAFFNKKNSGRMQFSAAKIGGFWANTENKFWPTHPHLRHRGTHKRIWGGTKKPGNKEIESASELELG